jgi:hypothetical protein
MSDEAELPELGALHLSDDVHTTKIVLEKPPILSTPPKIDTTLETALSHLLNRLTHPLSPILSPTKVAELKQALSDRLTAKYTHTWDEKRPLNGSGTRSLICTLHSGLPVELREVAKEVGVEQRIWLKALALVKYVDGKEVAQKTEWETWCDPGSVSWRYGGWQWEDVGFEERRISRGKLRIICSLASITADRQILSRLFGKPLDPLLS